MVTVLVAAFPRSRSVVSQVPVRHGGDVIITCIELSGICAQVDASRTSPLIMRDCIIHHLLSCYLRWRIGVSATTALAPVIDYGIFCTEELYCQHPRLTSVRVRTALCDATLASLCFRTTDRLYPVHKQREQQRAIQDENTLLAEVALGRHTNLD